jgi:hypothetical protein
MKDQEREPYEDMTNEAFDAFEESTFEPTEATGEGYRRPRNDNEQTRSWSILAHLSALAGYVVPLGAVIGPLVVWLIKRDEMPSVGEHARRALNFQITMMIGMIISIPLMFVFIGIPMLVVLGISQLVFTIIAGVKANEGEMYQYPFSLDLIKKDTMR